MLLIKDKDEEVPLVSDWPSLASTTTRTHPISPKNKLKTPPMKGKLKKEVKKAAVDKKKVEDKVVNSKVRKSEAAPKSQLLSIPDQL